jgi:hypothetical protein
MDQMARPNDTRPFEEKPSALPVESSSFPVEEEGDDDSLILWMLSLTPIQRLEVAQGFVNGVLTLRSGPARLAADS